MPISGRAKAHLGSDLPAILKYKGKTNESFLQLLINIALYSGGFAHKADQVLELLDPMCSRATSLFIAANYAWNSCGLDIDQNDLSEAERFLKRYFEYHRMKHEYSKESRTIPQSKPIVVSNFKFSPNPDAYRRGNVNSLRLARADAAQARELFGKEKFHIIVCDLPYGVQHAASGAKLDVLLERALPRWREALKKGGCVALSFNSNTMKRSKILDMMDAAGLEAKRGGVYEDFSHWVEQAVTRDIAVARRIN